MQGSSTRSDRTAFAPPSKTEPDSRSKRRSAKPAEARVAREAVAERQFCDSDLTSSVAKLMVSARRVAEHTFCDTRSHPQRRRTWLAAAVLSPVAALGDEHQRARPTSQGEQIRFHATSFAASTLRATVRSRGDRQRTTGPRASPIIAQAMEPA